MRKPTVPEVLPLVWAYYHKPDNESGGSLHIVLDDNNVEDSHVQFCINWAIDHDDIDGARLAGVLRLMSRTQRSKVAKLVYPNQGDEREFAQVYDDFIAARLQQKRTEDASDE